VLLASTPLHPFAGAVVKGKMENRKERKYQRQEGGGERACRGSSGYRKRRSGVVWETDS